MYKAKWWIFFLFHLFGLSFVFKYINLFLILILESEIRGIALGLLFYDHNG